nr:DUF6273 domain-containing protein [Lachnospiraceae bacterium]
MKRKTIINRIISLVLAAVMTVGNMNLPVMTVNAEPGWTKTVDNTGLGTGSIGDPKAPDSKDDPWTGSYVYYGTYGNQAAPVKYRVLDRETDRFGSKTIFLDCDTSLFYDAFRDDNTAENANVWAASDIYTVLNGDDNGSFLNSSFTGAERSAIAESSVGTHDITVGSPMNTNYTQYTALDKDRIFLLDFEDVLNPDYGYYNDCGCNSNMVGHDVDNHKKGAFSENWWLRSANSGESLYAGHVHNNGVVYGFTVSSGEGVSPAFNINLSSVIFSSEIKDGTGDNNYGAEYKLTVSDNKLSINAGNVTRDGNVVSIPYTITYSSDSAEPDRVSVIVVTGGEWTDAGWSDGTVLKQYEKPDAEAFGLSGTGTFTLDDDLADDEWGKDYRVYILAEDENDDEKGTDYASAPVEIKAINASVEGYDGAYDGQAHGISITLNDPVSGAAIKYGTTAESCVLNESPVVTDVNESAETVYYQITAP